MIHRLGKEIGPYYHWQKQLIQKRCANHGCINLDIERDDGSVEVVLQQRAMFNFKPHNDKANWDTEAMQKAQP